MTDTLADTHHVPLARLNQALADIKASPADHGLLRAIFIRPKPGERQELTRCRLSRALGADGDYWIRDSFLKTDSGASHPDVQIALMNARGLSVIAADRARWALAGDNLIVDLDLSPDNCPPGQKLKIGTATVEISAEPHSGCKQFVERYGREATVFVNRGEGRDLRLRGLYARIIEDGDVEVGDRVIKVVGALA